jgi:hypothetical protein
MTIDASERFSDDLLPLVRPIDFVIEDPDNAKLHPDESVDGIAASLTEYGQYKPVVYWMKDGQPVVKMGNGTWRAAKKLGWKRLAMSEFKGTENQVMGAAILDNKLPELSPWNEDVLKAQVATLGLDLPHWTAPEVSWTAPETFEAPPAPSPVIDVVVTPSSPTPAPPSPTTRVKPGDIWVMTSKAGDENRLMCGDPKNPRVIRELCGTARPPVRRMVVPPDERARWWTAPGSIGTVHQDLTVWPGWNSLSGALCGELNKLGWTLDNVERLTHYRNVFPWFQEGILIPEDAYAALQKAGAAAGAFQHPYASLEAFHRQARAQERADADYVNSIVTRILSPGEIFLDTDGGSGSFIGCIMSDLICFMVLASPEECDTVLETVERFTGRKAEKT